MLDALRALQEIVKSGKVEGAQAAVKGLLDAYIAKYVK